MDLVIRREGPHPIYLQIADYLREHILSGDLLPDTRLETEWELAQNLGISRGTVRQALIALENEGLVSRIPGKGTYVRGPVPKPRNSSSLIGFMVPYAHDLLTMEMLTGAEAALKGRGYQLLFCNCEGDRARQARDVRALLEQGICGLILFPVNGSSSAPTISWLQERNFPLVLVDRYLPEISTDYVVVDNYIGGYKATEHLILLGHERIGFVCTHDRHIITVAHRFAGYRQALEDYHISYHPSWLLEDLEEITPACILQNRLTQDQRNRDRALLNAYLQMENAPDAIFAENDLVAIRLLRCSQADGWRVPQDVALVGFDNLNVAANLTVPLTTIHQPKYEVGSQAARILMDRLERREQNRQQIVLPTTLVVRESCGARLRRREFQQATA